MTKDRSGQPSLFRTTGAIMIRLYEGDRDALEVCRKQLTQSSFGAIKVTTSDVVRYAVHMWAKALREANKGDQP